MTRIVIGDRVIHTRISDVPQLDFERTIKRIYGTHAFFQPAYGEKWSGGGTSLRAYGRIYRTLPNTGSGWSATCLTDRQLWVEVSPSPASEVAPQG